MCGLGCQHHRQRKRGSPDAVSVHVQIPSHSIADHAATSSLGVPWKRRVTPGIIVDDGRQVSVRSDCCCRAGIGKKAAGACAGRNVPCRVIAIGMGNRDCPRLLEAPFRGRHRTPSALYRRIPRREQECPGTESLVRSAASLAEVQLSAQ